MSSPLFRVSVPLNQAVHRWQLQETRAGFQYWVWPYAWRKTTANVTVVGGGARSAPAAPAPADPEVPSKAPPGPNSSISPPSSGERIPEDGAASLYEQPVCPLTGAGEAPAPEFRGARGSLVWKIPTRNRGVQE